LTFAEAVAVAADPIRVTGPDGAGWTVGAAKVSGATVTAPVEPTGPTGAYTVDWSVISDDGDAVKGAVQPGSLHDRVTRRTVITQSAPEPPQLGR
jgi:methionine-rich copper-binding protein CopC